MHTRLDPRAGFTALEAVVATGFLLLAMIPFFGSMQASVDSHETLATRDQLQERVRRATERIAHRLRSATFDSMKSVPEEPTTAGSIDFQRLANALLPDDELKLDELARKGGEEGGELLEPIKSALGGEGGEEEANTKNYEPASRLSFSEGRLRLEIGPSKVDLAEGLTDVKFSRTGRTIIVRVRADAPDGNGHYNTVTRRIHVTVRN